MSQTELVRVLRPPLPSKFRKPVGVAGAVGVLLLGAIGLRDSVSWLQSPMAKIAGGQFEMGSASIEISLRWSGASARPGRTVL